MIKQTAVLATAAASVSCVAALAPTTLASGPALATTHSAVASAAALHTCTTSRLTARASFLEGAAGTEIMGVRLTNHSRTSCTLQGFAKVTMVYGAHGATAGAAAIPVTTQRAARHVVRPGQSVSFYVTVMQGPVGGPTVPAGCGRIVPIRGFRIYPPASRTALFAPYTDLNGCTQSGLELMHVYPIGGTLR